MKVLFSCGGTGGHINPAIAIANTLKERYENFECLFVGAEGGMEGTLVPKSGYKIEFVKVRGFKRKLSLANVDAAIKAVTSVRAAKKIIKRFAPQVVVGTGGYASWAAVKAAASLGVPTLIHEQNAYPGMTTRKLSKYADKVCISFEESRKYFDGEVQSRLILTGNPLKPEVLKADRASARRELGLGDEIYVLSFGGSLGADKVNEYVIGLLDSYVKDNPRVRAIHATGKKGNAKYGEIAAKRGLNNANNIEIREYIYDMHRQLAASDLVICRAGAITIAENCCMGKPSVLIPSPNVTDNHQYKNAAVLRDAGAALLLEESATSGAEFTAAVKELIESPEKRKAMAAAALSLAKAGAADEIADLVAEAAKK